MLGKVTTATHEIFKEIFFSSVLGEDGPALLSDRERPVRMVESELAELQKSTAHYG